MRFRRGVNLIVAIGLGVALVTALGPTLPVRAAEYTLESAATYEVRPSDREIRVQVDLAFTNTTPDPDGQFSLFDELRLAIHDRAAAVTATDADGDLDVVIDEEDGVRVATIELREGLRFEDSIDIELRYRLVDGDDPEVRVGPSLVVFPAWGFGTTSEVTVATPDGYEVRVDGDSLTLAENGDLTSGPIEDPNAWLARVTAVGPADFVPFDATVPLEGGTADLLVRAFGDDPGWGEATRDLVVEALPVLEREIGLPYPLLGQLILTESVPADASGFGEPAARRAEIEVAYDQPGFTVIHQLAHLWLDPLVDARWVGEGIASDLAARVAAEIDVDLPYDPAAEAERLAADTVPLDTWRSGSDPASSAYAHPASWALVASIRGEVGDDALRTILARTAASIGPYDEAEVDAPPAGTVASRTPLTSRSLLDQVASVSGVDVTERFEASVFSEDDTGRLPDRAAARTAFADLLVSADGWGAPDPIRAAMTDWAFADAAALIEAADSWLAGRNDLLADIERVGLSRPERLPQVFRSYGGGAEAIDELAAERAVVDAYADAAGRVNMPRSLLARLGLVGGADPAVQLGLANGRFADGDLPGALDSIGQAVRVLDSAETTGLVRIVSLVLVIIGLAAVAVTVFRRRAAYTAAR
jgi:hypothetical protein